MFLAAADVVSFSEARTPAFGEIANTCLLYNVLWTESSRRAKSEKFRSFMLAMRAAA
jgi:hypothetical protein